MLDPLLELGAGTQAMQDPLDTEFTHTTGISWHKCPCPLHTCTVPPPAYIHLLTLFYHMHSSLVQGCMPHTPRLSLRHPRWRAQWAPSLHQGLRGLLEESMQGSECLFHLVRCLWVADYCVCLVKLCLHTGLRIHRRMHVSIGDLRRAHESYKELTHWKRPWLWERLRAGGEGGDRGWDGWMALLTQWTWVWANSKR